MKKILSLAAAILALCAVGCDKEYTPDASLSATFNQAYPDAVDVEWEREHHHIVAEFKLPGVSNECEAWFTKGGTWVLTTFDIAYSSLPEAVRNAFESEYGSMTPVDSVTHVERSNGDDVYFIEIESVLNDELVDIFLDYNANGELLRTWVDVEYYENIYYYL